LGSVYLPNAVSGNPPEAVSTKLVGPRWAPVKDLGRIGTCYTDIGCRSTLDFSRAIVKNQQTDATTDMSGHKVACIPEVEIDARGVTSTLKISMTSTMSGIPKICKSSR